MGPAETSGTDALPAARTAIWDFSVPQHKVDIRAYRPADLDLLIDLFRQSVRKIARSDYTPAQLAAWAPDDIDREATAKRNLARPTWIAATGDDIAGFIDLEPDGHLDRLFVHPDYRKSGVANALYAHVETAAREQRIARIYAEVSITARPFFERHGFVVVAPQTVHVRGQDFINFKMEKKLTRIGFFQAGIQQCKAIFAWTVTYFSR